MNTLSNIIVGLGSEVRFASGVVKGEFISVDHYVTTHATKVEAWIASHPWIYLGVGILLGWTIAGYLYH